MIKVNKSIMVLQKPEAYYCRPVVINTIIFMEVELFELWLKEQKSE